MKTVYLIGGAMGVGKTTVSQQLKKDLANSVFLDGDWCWDADPFQVTDETKEMVMDNICYLLNNFLHCSAYENVIFCWVMHEQSIVDEIVSKLDTEECRVIKISLIVDEANLRKRLLSVRFFTPRIRMNPTRKTKTASARMAAPQVIPVSTEEKTLL